MANGSKHLKDGCGKKDTWVEYGKLELRDYLRYFEEKPFTGVAVRKYKNGQKWFEDTYKDGRQHGLSTSWYENGQKEKEATFKDGKELGPVTEKWYGYVRKYYVKQVQELLEDTIKDGKQHGSMTGWYGWYKNGQKALKENYKDDKIMSAVAWKPNGDKCPVTNVKGGNGVLVLYFEDGTEDSRYTYKDGERVKTNP